jgi:hypothetical protein
VSPKVTRKRGPRLQAAQDPLPLGEMEGYDLDNDPLKGLEGGTNKRR